MTTIINVAEYRTVVDYTSYTFYDKDLTDITKEELIKLIENGDFDDCELFDTENRSLDEIHIEGIETE